MRRASLLSPRPCRISGLDSPPTRRYLALKVAGDQEGARAAVARARELAADIAEDEDRDLLLGDLATIDG
jgi:hypothetical protein